jgi:hypothetical protein
LILASQIRLSVHGESFGASPEDKSVQDESVKSGKKKGYLRGDAASTKPKMT